MLVERRTEARCHMRREAIRTGRSAAGRLWLARHETPRLDHVFQQDALAPGYACIAVAILDDDDTLLGALCAAGRSDRREMLQGLVPRLRAAATMLAPLID